LINYLRPGPISNLSLKYKIGNEFVLRKDMIEHHDYEVIPSELWHQLVQWYGM